MIKYKYLWAWDRILRSTESWSVRKQVQAKEENAPLNCIYRDTDGTWHTFDDITSQETKDRVQSIVKYLKAKEK